MSWCIERKVEVVQSRQTNKLMTHVKLIHCNSVFSTISILILNNMQGYHGMYFVHVSSRAIAWVGSGTHASVHIWNSQSFLEVTLTSSSLQRWPTYQNAIILSWEILQRGTCSIYLCSERWFLTRNHLVVRRSFA